MRSSAIHHGSYGGDNGVARWCEFRGMRLPATYAREGDPAQLALADVSHLERWGLKGPGAAAHLTACGVPVPALANHWCDWQSATSNGLVARLGHSEFFLESNAALPGPLAAGRLAADAYPVPHADTGFVLLGTQVHALLAQVCSIDFAARDVARREVLMTSMAGVSVLVIPLFANGLPLYRIWCDPSFGTYLHHTLLSIVEELGGGPLGLDRLAPLLDSAIHSTGTP